MRPLTDSHIVTSALEITASKVETILPLAMFPIGARLLLPLCNRFFFIVYDTDKMESESEKATWGGLK